MSETITYVRKDRDGHVERVAVPRESVVYKEETEGYLDDTTTTLFVEALKKSGVPVDELVRDARGWPNSESDLPAGPLACIEQWHCEEPWPVFITIGNDCYGEFYPEAFAG